MLAITCDKCRRRYTATDEELRVYLKEAEGKKFAQVLCPHCGKANKVAGDRIHQALRFSPAPVENATDASEEASSVTEATADDTAVSGAVAPQGPTEEANPLA